MESEKTHLTAQEMEQYRQRTLSSVARERCDRHLATCGDCLEQVLGEEHSNLPFARLMEAFGPSAEEPFHLSSDDLRRYVTGQTDEADKTIFESHLENCQECREAQASFLATVARAEPTAAPMPERHGISSPSLWARLIGLWRWPRYLTPARLAGATVLAASVLVFWVAWHYQGRANLSEQASRPSKRGMPTAAALRLRDGGAEITIDEKGHVAGLEWLSSATEEKVKQALLTVQLAKPQVLEDLSSPATKFLGERADQSRFALLEPVGKVITEDQPTLQWQPLHGATAYVASVFDTQFRIAVKSKPLSATEWRLPVPLHRGSTYSWQVTATRDHQQITAPVAPAPRAQFRVLDRQTMEALENVRVQRPNAHLTLGVLYAQAGLLSDSEREFQALMKENPDSAIARNLLHAVQAWKSEAKTTD